MNTIRQRLTWRLLLGWTLLLLVGGGVAYFTTRAALTRQFDEVLHTKAMTLTTVTEQDNSEIKVEFADLSLREFDTDVRTAFFQIWRSDGAVVERSPSLRGASLPLRYGTLQSPQFWNLELLGDRASRAVGFRFRPKSADEAKTQARPVEAILVVAADRRNLDKALATLAAILGGSGLLVLVLTTVTVPRLMRRELAPLDQLAEQTQRITAETLAARFPADGLPGELAPISSRLNDLMQRLQTAFERERQFSDDLAHEFRTPIAELRSLAELALKWPDTRGADTDRQVLAIAVQMESIINRLLAMTRREQGRVPVSPEPVNLAALVTAVCQLVQARAAARELAIETNISAPQEIRSDPVLLRSILVNLVDNAVEYARPRGAVRIHSEAQNGVFRLVVTNPVEHLHAEDVPRLFDRFWRKDAARSSAEHSGLGLSLARALAASLGYTLNAAMDGDASLAMTLSGPLKLEHQPAEPMSDSENAA